MPEYSVNTAAMTTARELIDAGEVDTTTEWSDAAPTTDRENEVVDRDGYDGFGRWHLGIDPDASEQTKGRYGFGVRRLLARQPGSAHHAKQRAKQNDHDAVADAADELLRRMDEREG